MPTDDGILALLASQDGLITDTQAFAHGMAVRTLRRRLAAGGWGRVAPGVLLAGGHPWTDRARVRAVGHVGRRPRGGVRARRRVVARDAAVRA